MDFKKVAAVMAGALTPARIAAALMIGVGLWGLVYGHFSFYSSHEAQWRGVDMSFKDAATVYVPMWVSVGVIVFGGLLMLARHKD